MSKLDQRHWFLKLDCSVTDSGWITGAGCSPARRATTSAASSARRRTRPACPGSWRPGARLIGSKGDWKLADDAYAVDGELAYAHVQNNSSQARPRTCHVCKCACLFGRVSCLSVETKDEILRSVSLYSVIRLLRTQNKQKLTVSVNLRNQITSQEAQPDAIHWW